jgi:carbon monoxide dehydrogenase subunit G
MEMQGSRRLAISQQQAWDALNDPGVLKTCIPGCEKVEATGENQYAMAMAVRIGPVSAKFNGKIALADVLPPNSYTLNFEGQGGAAGFGKGSAKVSLAPPAEGGGCELTYSATAQVGGKIAQVGQRLVDGVARSMAEDFFKRFDEEMQRQHPEAYAAAAALPPASPTTAAPAAAPEPAKSIPVWIWIAIGVAVIGAYALFGR